MGEQNEKNLLRLYFDTTTWVRLFETGNEKIINERNAIHSICTQKFDIITSQFQIRQMYSKKNSNSISAQQKSAFEQAIATCESIAIEPPRFDLYYGNYLKEFTSKTQLQHQEDRIHIVLSWLYRVDYFITTDYELFKTEKSSIEVALAGMVHPTTPNNFHTVNVLNPVDFTIK